MGKTVWRVVVMTKFDHHDYEKYFTSKDLAVAYAERVRLDRPTISSAEIEEIQLDL